LFLNPPSFFGAFAAHHAGAAGACGGDPKATAGEPEAVEPGERERMAISESFRPRRSWQTSGESGASKSSWKTRRLGGLMYY
jgi:hypothetical protein